MFEVKKFSLVVSNLESKATEELLRFYFGSQCGESPIVKIRRDAKTCRSLCYAILEFQHKEAYDKAIDLDRTKLGTKRIKVRTADKLNCEAAEMKRGDNEDEDDEAKPPTTSEPRFVPRSIASQLKRCPGCFLPLIGRDFVAMATAYYCPTCHRRTKLVRDFDQRLILAQCRICFDLCHVNQMIPCRSDHIFCQRCVSRWLEHCTIYGTGGKTFLPCPLCDSLFLRSEIASRVSEAQLTIFEASLPRTLVLHHEAPVELKSDNSTLFRRCPRCSCSWIADEEAVKQRKAKASRCPQPGCWHQFCSKCLSPWSSDINVTACDMCKIIDNAKEQQYWEERKARIKNRQCPKCSLPLLRHDGSNYVVCGQCETSICFICREPNIDIVRHFCRCFRDPNDPDKHSCKRRCLIFQDSEAYDAEQLRLLEQERAKSASSATTNGHGGSRKSFLADNNNPLIIPI